MTLSDLIIEHGRWWPGQSVKEVLGLVVECAELNALRDELVELRRLREAAVKHAALLKASETNWPGTTFTQPATTERPELHVQWKGTEVCADFHCSCGADGHIDDAMFCYTIRCGRCGKAWDVPTSLALTPSTETLPHVEVEPDDPRDTDWSRQ